MKQLFVYAKSARAVRKTSAVLVGFCFVLLITTHSSQAFTVYEAVDETSKNQMAGMAGNPSKADQPSSIETDQCLSLLRTIRYTPSESVQDRNQRSAGKAAALGLVFGVRFALSPPHNHKVETRHKARLDLWTQKGRLLTENRPALAVSAYRQCRKEKALQA